jgi:hypothetical protein
VTGFSAIFLALVAGLTMSNRRQMTIVILVPFLLVLAVQTWSLAAGLGVNPPSTVTQFPGNIAYFVVQLIIFALAFEAADQIRMLRLRRARTNSAPVGDRSVEPSRRVRIAILVNIVISAVAVAVFHWDSGMFDPGSVAHHTGNGSIPIGGVLGILALPLVIVVLGAVNFAARRTQRANVIGQPAARVEA